MTRLQQIAQFQEALFEILDREVPPLTALNELRADPRTFCYAAVLHVWDPHMVSVAQQLMKKWGVQRVTCEGSENPSEVPFGSRGEGL